MARLTISTSHTSAPRRRVPAMAIFYPFAVHHNVPRNLFRYLQTISINLRPCHGSGGPGLLLHILINQLSEITVIILVLYAAEDAEDDQMNRVSASNSKSLCLVDGSECAPSQSCLGAPVTVSGADADQRRRNNGHGMDMRVGSGLQGSRRSGHRCTDYSASQEASSGELLQLVVVAARIWQLILAGYPDTARSLVRLLTSPSLTPPTCQPTWQTLPPQMYRDFRPRSRLFISFPRNQRATVSRPSPRWAIRRRLENPMKSSPVCVACTSSSSCH
jgi:hypothetical protein